jgi:hypothetical protein
MIYTSIQMPVNRSVVIYTSRVALDMGESTHPPGIFLPAVVYVEPFPT